MPLPSRQEQTNLIAMNRQFAEMNKRIDSLERTIREQSYEIEELKKKIAELQNNQNPPA